MKTCICVFVGAALGGIATSEAFVFSPSAVGVRHRALTVRQQHAQAMTAEPEAEPKADGEAGAGAEGEAEEVTETKKWDRKSIPKKKAEFLSLPEDARNWEVEEERDAVWEGDPNPPLKLDWADAFGASDEEMEAADWGFDWIHPDDWFAVEGEKQAKRDAKRKATMEAALKAAEEAAMKAAKAVMDAAEEAALKAAEEAGMKAGNAVLEAAEGAEMEEVARKAVEEAAPKAVGATMQTGEDAGTEGNEVQ